MNAGDKYLYEDILKNQLDVNTMIDKEVLYVSDQNNGSYNGQITFDTSSLSNNGRWAAYNEATMVIPFVISMKSSVNISADAARPTMFSVGIKNGFYQLVDSIQVEYNNTGVVQLTPFTNFYVNYKVLSSFSQDDLTKHGALLGICPDSAGSTTYSAAAVINGDGFRNNEFLTDEKKPLNRPDQVNQGLIQRQADTTADGANGYGTLGMLNAANHTTLGKGYYDDGDAVAAAGKTYSWTVLAVIRLKDVADFFDKLPLVRGASIRLTVNYNSCINNITCGADRIMSLAAASPYVSLSGRTAPVMVGSSAEGAPNGGASLEGTLTVSCGVVNNSLKSGLGLLTQCRLYVPTYQMNPIYLDQIKRMASPPIKTVAYTDIFNKNIVSVASGQPFNELITNGIINPKYVVVTPFVNSTAAGFFANAVGVNVFQSPFDPSPGTTSPQAALTNFNIQVGGSNIFQQDFRYDFESFRNELEELNALNGGKSDGLTSGLISKYMWDNAYRYYVGNVSRRLPADDNRALSISIIGTNATQRPLSLVCFVVYERKVRINMDTSELVA